MKKNKENHKISVIINCFNLEKYLLEAVSSVKAQTFYPHEIIVIHDGCKEAVSIVGTTTIFLSENTGISNARNLAAKITTGTHLLFVDADDMLEFNYIEKLVKNSNFTNIVYPNCILWSSYGNSGLKNEKYHPPRKLTLKKLLKLNQVLISSLIPKPLFEKIGGFQNVPLYEDWLFFLKAIKLTQFTASDAYLYYRQREGSRNRSLPKEEKLKIIEQIRKIALDY